MRSASVRNQIYIMQIREVHTVINIRERKSNTEETQHAKTASILNEGTPLEYRVTNRTKNLEAPLAKFQSRSDHICQYSPRMLCVSLYSSSEQC